MILKDLGEFDLIKRLTGSVRLSNRVIKGAGDDTAVLKYKKNKLLLFTCDMLLEGVHFEKRFGAYLIGKKAVSVNISDIAAMGGIPDSLVVSLGVPGSLDIRFADELYKGIKDTAMAFGVDFVGGDTIASDKIIISISLLGHVETKNLILRSTAKEGDLVYVTGTIGGSLKGKHLDFTPRLEEARFLAANFKPSSMIDVSDGLFADIAHILRSSKRGAIVYEEKIPLSGSAGRFKNAVTDGEDFEIVFTVSPEKEKPLLRKWPFKAPISKIGEIRGIKEGFCLIRKNGKKEKVNPKGYRHF